MVKLNHPEPKETVIMYCGACGTYMETNFVDLEIRPLEIEGCDHFNLVNAIKFISCCGTYSKCNDYDGFYYLGGAYSGNI